VNLWHAQYHHDHNEGHPLHGISRYGRLEQTRHTPRVETRLPSHWQRSGSVGVARSWPAVNGAASDIGRVSWLLALDGVHPLISLVASCSPLPPRRDHPVPLGGLPPDFRPPPVSGASIPRRRSLLSLHPFSVPAALTPTRGTLAVGPLVPLPARWQGLRRLLPDPLWRALREEDSSPIRP
jgi:hypothetical protein